MICYLRVNDFVPAQGTRLPKSLATNFADKRSGPRMDWHVSGQIVMCIENLGRKIQIEK